MSPMRTYHVTVERQDEFGARASAHGHTLSVGVKRGDSTAGFNAAETLLAALGTCLITNVNALSEKMRLHVDSVRVEIEGDRRDEPPGIVQIRYCLWLDSPEPEEKLEKLHDLAFAWGAVTNTLTEGVQIDGAVGVMH
jgi:putative redox protein